jgi:hypothetical protein
MPGSLKVPIYLFDEHNEAFFFWHVARYDGLIDSPLDLIHIDAHDDMRRKDESARSIYHPGILDRSAYLDYYQDFAKSELDTDNFILPAVLDRLVRNIYYVFPAWRNLKIRRRRMSICSAFGEGKILKYNLRIDEDTNQLAKKTYPDFTRFLYFSLPPERIPRNRKVILDIDLDYFACRDTIQNQMSYQLEVTREQFDAKNVVLGDRTLKFSGLEIDFTEKNGKYFAGISSKKVRDVSHLPPKSEVASEIRNLVKSLVAKNVRPLVITICRSCISGYCPSEYAGFIEEELLRELRLWVGCNA